MIACPQIASLCIVTIGGCVFCPLLCHVIVRKRSSEASLLASHDRQNSSQEECQFFCVKSFKFVMRNNERCVAISRIPAHSHYPGNTIRGKNDTDKVGRDYWGQLAASSQNSEANIGNNFNSLYFVTLYATPITSFSLICFNIELKRMDFSHFRVRGTLSSLQWYLVELVTQSAKYYYRLCLCLRSCLRDRERQRIRHGFNVKLSIY